MNYSQKRTLVGRIVYIGLTLMAVTILCVTMFSFFGGSKEAKETNPPVKLPQTTASGGAHQPPETAADTLLPNHGGVTDVPTTEGSAETSADEETESRPTVAPPSKDWNKLKVSMPVDGVIVKRHDTVNAVFSVTMNDYRVHRGVDIECADGAEVYSCAYGTVKTVGYDPFMGYTVTVDHGDGLVSCYQNLADILADNIAVGSTVYAGQLLGMVGESAIIEIADESHLHFELELNGTPVDPMNMLEYTESTGGNESEEDSK